MVYTDENKTCVIIFSGRIANELLRRHYRIVEVRPDKKNRIKTVFIFKVERNIENAVYSLTDSDNIFG